MGKQYWARRVYDLCVYFMTGTPKGSTESGFMEKLGIEPATPGLQDIGLSPTPRWLQDWVDALAHQSETYTKNSCIIRPLNKSAL